MEETSVFFSCLRFDGISRYNACTNYHSRINNFLKSWSVCVLYEADITRRIANYCNFSTELKCVLQAFPDSATQYVRYGHKRVLWKATK